MGKSHADNNLLRLQDGVVFVPFLIKGRLVLPPDISRKQAEAAFDSAEKSVTCVRLPEAQIVREPIIDRETMVYTGEYRYEVMPPVDPEQLIEKDIDKLVRGLYALRVDDIVWYLETMLAAFASNAGTVERVWDIMRTTSELPESFLDASVASLASTLNRDLAMQMIDSELSQWGRPGSEFLDGWVEDPSGGIALAQTDGSTGIDRPDRPHLRAMPTRQLHITAGNAPEVPLISILHAVLTKSAAAIKLPYGAILPGALFSLLAAETMPEHPITQNLSVVYWGGGDEKVESVLFAPNAFDRILVWGSPEAVASVRSRAHFTRTVFFNPRYGVSLIGREAFEDALAVVAAKAAADAMIMNQKACSASLIHYVEGDDAQVRSYAVALQKALFQWDKRTPNFVRPAVIGDIKRMRRGRYSDAGWYLNESDGRFMSGVVVMNGEFDILDHPMSRLVVIRPMARLDDALKYLHQGVSTVGIYPESRRLELKDRVAARGVSNVLPLGDCERVFAGMPQDGMRVLNELVDWKVG